MSGYGDNYGEDYGNALSLPVESYLKLVSSQYQLSPKFMAHLSSILEKLEGVTDLVDSMSVAFFDLDTAVGPQLDILGEIIGRGRDVSFQPSGGISPVLDDDNYRLLLKAKIAQNSWDGKVGYLYDIWTLLFPGGKILINDSQNMSAVITMSGSFSTLIQELIENEYIVPRPQGVQYTYGFGDLPFFGFDRDDAYISGFDTGNIT
jgi:hypothetical protein